MSAYQSRLITDLDASRIQQLSGHRLPGGSTGLSPLGRALIGRSLGHTATVEQPDGGLREIRVLRIHYQPEAAGEFTR